MQNKGCRTQPLVCSRASVGLPSRLFPLFSLGICTVDESYCPQAATLDAHARRCNMLPEIIFLDAISLPCGADSENYWAYWRTPHVFFYQDGDLDLAGHTGKTRPCVPMNWEERAIHLSHWEAGGGASSLWVIVVWYPPGIPPCDQIPLGSQPWFPKKNSF
jgi:hypothetical protein